MTYFEAQVAGPFEPTALLTSCIENGARSLLLDEGVIPVDFFDLSTGLAGELLHKLTAYRICLAGVVPDPSIHSVRFQDFAREANRGTQYRFFPTRQEAIDWLESLDRSSGGA
jgi:hypothetical protein